MSHRLSKGKDHGEWKSHSGLKLVSDSCTQQSYFSGDFSTYTPKYVDKTSHFANNLYFSYNERRFHSEYHSRVKFRSKSTWFLIDISFWIEWLIRNEKWNELDPEWVATQSPMISTETEWVRSELKLSPDSRKHPLTDTSPLYCIVWTRQKATRGDVLKLQVSWPKKSIIKLSKLNNPAPSRKWNVLAAQPWAHLLI